MGPIEPAGEPTERDEIFHKAGEDFIGTMEIARNSRAAPAIFHASAGRMPLFQQIFQILHPPKLRPDRSSEERGSSSPR